MKMMKSDYQACGKLVAAGKNAERRSDWVEEEEENPTQRPAVEFGLKIQTF